MNRLNGEIRTLTNNLDTAIDERIQAEKLIKDLAAEREKMKFRIKKLKNRKGKVDLAIKMCRICNKEFHEKENFNWSCRSH